MVIHQGPGNDSRLGVFGNLSKARAKIFAVLILLKDGATFSSPDHCVVEDPSSIQSGLSWHEILLPQLGTVVK